MRHVLLYVRMISFSNNAELAPVAEPKIEEEKKEEKNEEIVIQVVEAVVANDNVEVTKGMSHDYLQYNKKRYYVGKMHSKSTFHTKHY